MYGLTITNDINTSYISQYKEVFKFKKYEYGKDKKIKPKKIKFLTQPPVKREENAEMEIPEVKIISNPKVASIESVEDDDLNSRISSEGNVKPLENKEPEKEGSRPDEKFVQKEADGEVKKESTNEEKKDSK